MTLRTAFTDQAWHCEQLGSPFMARLMSLLSERLETGTPVADRVLGWAGDPAPTADSVPLRLAGALHAIKLRGLALEDVYPPRDVDDDTLWSALKRAMTQHSAQVLDWLEQAPQTNEVRRAAVILPALCCLQDRYGMPVELLELGTSGGLNLRADHFRLDLSDRHIGPDEATVVLAPEWSGHLPPCSLPRVVGRSGVDISPVDSLAPEGRLKLLAYLWADQPDRLARTEAAIELARRIPAKVDAEDAGAWTMRALARPAPDRLRVVFHTVAAQYFPDETRESIETAIDRATGPIARLAMENDGGRGAGVTMTWPDGQTDEIARADFHGRWVEWRLPGAT